ncbi:MAG TPA: coniferyl aldehyde dehydrogenase, partial [Oceanicaulis sp.]|nr:coniferyl aldehyde dehydrogenase [Oceanicaulis sp.]
MSDAAARQIERMKSVFDAQKSAFRASKVRPYGERKADLEKLEAMVKEKADAFAAAVSADYGRRSAAETQIAEIGFTLATAKHTRQKLKS